MKTTVALQLTNAEARNIVAVKNREVHRFYVASAGRGHYHANLPYGSSLVSPGSPNDALLSAITRVTLDGWVICAAPPAIPGNDTLPEAEFHNRANMDAYFDDIPRRTVGAKGLNRIFAARGGQSTSPEKQAAARTNGEKGGRPPSK